MDVSRLKKKVENFLQNEDVQDFIIEPNEGKLKYSEEIKGSAKANSSNIFRSLNYKLNMAIEQVDGFMGERMSSKYEMFRYVMRYYKNKDFLGQRTREIVDGKIKLGSYVFRTYAEVTEEIEIFASALFSFENIENSMYEDNGKYCLMKILGIWAKNRVEWFITDMAASAIDFVTVPVYDTIGISSVEYIFEKTKMQACCTEFDKLETLIEMKKNLTYLSILIVYDDINMDMKVVEKAREVGYKIYFYKDLVETYKDKNFVSDLYRSEEDKIESSQNKSPSYDSSKKIAETEGKENGTLTNVDEGKEGEADIDEEEDMEDTKSVSVKNEKGKMEGSNEKDEKEDDGEEEEDMDDDNDNVGSTTDTKAFNGSVANDENGGRKRKKGKKKKNKKKRRNTNPDVGNNIGTEKRDGELKDDNDSGTVESGGVDHNKSNVSKHTSESKKGSTEFKRVTAEYYRQNRLDCQGVCSILFTSGSTGIPKGVMLSHQNFISFVQSYLIDGNRLGIKKFDIILSYLPLAHAYERYIEFAICFFGARIGYFSGNIKDILGDLNELKPTFFIAVPRILQKIHDSIMEGIKSKSFFTRMLVKTAIKKKKNIYLKNSNRFHHNLYDMILQPIRNKFGGSIRIQVMGSSSMDRNKLIDLQMIFSTPIMEGWGMTEVGIAFLQKCHDSTKGTIGGPFSNTMMKVCKVENMKYDPKGTPNRGELYVKGSGIMLGYMRDEKLTKSSFDEDGFFRTGDIVEILENGGVRIIDKAKNIFKLSQGEYIEPEKLENCYLDSMYINQICVHGYSYENELVAIIVPVDTSIMDYAKKNNMNKPYEELLKDPAIRKLIADDLLNISKKRKLNGFEKIRLFHLTPVIFSVENKQLTPTHKIVRREIVHTYEKEIKELYKNRKDFN